MKFISLIPPVCVTILMLGQPLFSFAASPAGKVPPLPAVERVRATAGQESVFLRWQPVPGSDGYRIFCEKEQDGYRDRFRLDVPAVPPRAEVKDLQAGATYTYRISALKEGQEGPPSLATIVSLQPTGTPTPSDAAR